MALDLSRHDVVEYAVAVEAGPASMQGSEGEETPDATSCTRMETISMPLKTKDVLRQIAAARGGSPFPQQVQHLQAKRLESRA